MSEFASEWLALREPVDHSARYRYTAELEAFRRGREQVRVVDLGTGTGSNFRFLAPRLGPRQIWTAIDDDSELLAAIPAILGAWGGALTAGGGSALSVTGPGFGARFECRRLDLSRRLEALEIPAQSLVTASALLDLVSDGWLEGLADRCRAAAATVLFALSYDGRIEILPADEDDELVRALVNRHQTTDKGFGPALGPAAAERLISLFSAAGYALESVRSDWKIAPDRKALQLALIGGWHSAAVAMAPHLRRTLDAWRARRESIAEAGTGSVIVGHVDVFGRPREQGLNR